MTSGLVRTFMLNLYIAEALKMGRDEEDIIFGAAPLLEYLARREMPVSDEVVRRSIDQVRQEIGSKDTPQAICLGRDPFGTQAEIDRQKRREEEDREARAGRIGTPRNPIVLRSHETEPWYKSASRGEERPCKGGRKKKQPRI